MSEDRSAAHPLRVLITVGLGVAFSQIGATALYIILPLQTAQTGVALGMVGLLLGANQLVAVLLNAPVGLAYDRWPRRRLFVPALFLGAFSSLLVAATWGAGPLLASRLLSGLAWAVISIGGPIIILDVAPAESRGRWAGLYSTWAMLGMVVGSIASGLVADRFGFHATMYAAAGLAAVGSLPALFFLPGTGKISSAERTPEQQASPPEPIEKWGLGVVIGLATLNDFITFGVIAGTIALLVHALLPATNLAIGVATATGLLAASRVLLSLFVAPLAGILSDRLGQRWPVVLGSLLIGIVAMLLMASTVPRIALTGLALGAFYGSSLRVMLTALVGDMVGRAQRGRALGALNIGGDLGLALGPIVAFALLPVVGLSGVYIGCAALLLLGTAMVIWYRLRRSNVAALGSAT